MEMRSPERAVARRRAPAGLYIRGHLPPAHGLSRQKPGFRLVLDPGRRMAPAESHVRTMAEAGEFRQPRKTAHGAGGIPPGLGPLLVNRARSGRRYLPRQSGSSVR